METRNHELTEEQNLRLFFFDRYRNAETAQAAYNFVMQPAQNESYPQSSNVMPDGVYFVMKDDTYLFDNEENRNTLDKSNVKGIGIKMGEKSLVVALKDIKDGEDIKLTSNDDNTNWNGYKNNYLDAVADWNGQSNTEHLKTIGLAFNLEEGWFIPSAGQLYLMFLFRKAINSALEFVDGQPLAGDWYWTSTEYSSTNAWHLYLLDGNMSGSAKASYLRRVRPVSIFNG